MKTIAPSEARKLLAQGALLIDVREPDEHRRERIPGAQSAPLSSGALAPAPGRMLIYHCKGGNRTAANASLLKDAADGASCEAYVLEGGIEAWQAAGLPVTTDRTAPVEIMRQVQMTAGALVLAGVILGFLLHPAFHVLSGFVGAGLFFAGATGWCGMAKLLALMPWNRLAARPS